MIRTFQLNPGPLQPPKISTSGEVKRLFGFSTPAKPVQQPWYEGPRELLND